MILPLADLAPIGPFAQPRPMMVGRYRISQLRKVRMMTALDGLLSLVPKRRSNVPADPQRILIANWAHLGDVVTSFGLIAALRMRYPDAHIGMIVGSWGKPAIAEARLVDEVHVVDHWAMNRSRQSRLEKIRRYRHTRHQALQEIRATGYQVGIDLMSIFPPAHPLFYRAGIPVRIGYTSGGFGPLLTHPVPWRNEDRRIADQFRDLADQLDPARPYGYGTFRPRRHRASVAGLPAALLEAGDYIVLHPGAGAEHKDWGIENWRALISRLRTAYPQRILVLTGAGAGEVAIAENLAQAAPGVLSLAGKVGWDGFVAAVAGASLVICPDTATGHVAALFDVPVVAIFNGNNKTTQWAPYGEQVSVLVRPVACAPCTRGGCEVMACIRDVTVDDVIRAAGHLLT